MKTYIARPSDITRKWFLVDAKDLVLGRLSVVLANYVRGKHKATYTPSIDCGDNIVVINAKKVNLSGNKWDNKTYISHSGYPGGQKIKTAKEVFAKNPSILIEKAVKGMLPKNKLGSVIFKNLRVYNDENHNQSSQNPESININEF